MGLVGVVASVIALLSGCAALLFETLWFHAASIAFGSGVWASSLVLSSFMAGLALGNFVAGRFGPRLAHPLRAYGALELVIGLAGAALAIGLAPLSDALAPLLAPLRERQLLLNAARFGLGFALMTIPATAMGATLPVLVGALFRSDPRFGPVLGRRSRSGCSAPTPSRPTSRPGSPDRRRRGPRRSISAPRPGSRRAATPTPRAASRPRRARMVSRAE